MAGKEAKYPAVMLLQDGAPFYIVCWSQEALRLSTMGDNIGDFEARMNDTDLVLWGGPRKY